MISRAMPFRELPQENLNQLLETLAREADAERQRQHAVNDARSRAIGLACVGLVVVGLAFGLLLQIDAMLTPWIRAAGGG
jgi:hypothetical protein